MGQMGDQVFILSNGGSGMRWWTRGEADETLEAIPPKEYERILDLDLFRSNHEALALYVLQDGRMCCLLNALRTGKLVANSRVPESLLLIHKEPQLCTAQRLLAQAYLRGQPSAGHRPIASEEIRRILRMIVPAGRVKVDWPAFFGAIDAIPKVQRTSLKAKRSYGEDNPANRQLLEAVLNDPLRAEPGTVVAVVAPLAERVAFRKAGVLWGLSRLDSLKGKRIDVVIIEPEPVLQPQLTEVIPASSPAPQAEVQERNIQNGIVPTVADLPSVGRPEVLHPKNTEDIDRSENERLRFLRQLLAFFGLFRGFFSRDVAILELKLREPGHARQAEGEAP